jgi:nucleoid DNA-binding protein
MAKAAPAGAAPAKKAKAPSKSEMLGNIAATTGLSKKQVGDVLEALGNEIKKALSNKGPGVVQIPGLVKITKQKVPARPAQKGVPNPFKPGELMDRPAKPASVKVKVRALKSLKEMV